jgi:hypothetical protein
MQAILLTIHIATFSLSLLAFPALALVAFGGIQLPRAIMKSSLILTLTGLISGLALLVAHPTGARCLALTAYLASFIFLYRAAQKATLSAQTAKEYISRR